nr:CAP domain-containing protein [Paenibacillus periandrae]
MFKMILKKSVLTGLLALGTIVGATAASAAPCTVTTGNDTLSTIAKQQGINLNDLFKANPQITNGNNIWPGMVLNLPGIGAGQGLGFGFGSGAGTNVDKGTNVDTGTNTDTGSHTGTGTGSDTGTTNPGTGTSVETGSGSDSTVQQGTTESAFASQVVDLVNQERAKAGLNPLTSDSALSAMALDKAKDMYNNHYFDHNSPTYGSPFDMMNQYGIKYTYAGENIAMGQKTPQEVMTSWMNSEGHRQNIMNPNYTKIGVSYYNGEWVQEFIAN